jgi:hypothetical protein
VICLIESINLQTKKGKLRWLELSTLKAGYLNPATVQNQILNHHSMIQSWQKLCENLFGDTLKT